MKPSPQLSSSGTLYFRASVRKSIYFTSLYLLLVVNAFSAFSKLIQTKLLVTWPNLQHKNVWARMYQRGRGEMNECGTVMRKLWVVHLHNTEIDKVYLARMWWSLECIFYSWAEKHTRLIHVKLGLGTVMILESHSAKTDYPICNLESPSGGESRGHVLDNYTSLCQQGARRRRSWVRASLLVH